MKDNFLDDEDDDFDDLLDEDEESSLGETALVVLDLQTSLLATIPHRERLLERASFVIQAARLFNIPIWATEQAPEKLGSTEPRIRELLHEAGASFFAKHTFSAFEDEDFLADLASSDVSHVILIGIETPICVFLSAFGALREDFQVTVLYDAIDARREQDAEFALRTLERAGAHVLPAETLFYTLMGTSDRPEFKELTRLVKDAGTPRLKDS